MSRFIIQLDEEPPYHTSKTEIKVPLSITVEGKGTTLDGINPKYIKPKKSIIEAVKKETKQIITSILRNTPPENYYTKFEELSQEIKTHLKNTYSLNFKMDQEDLRISISPLLTELEERYNKLFAEHGKIRIESQSDATYYEIRFSIEAVNNWFVFHKNHIKYYNQTTLEYKDIGDYIKDKIELDVTRIEGNYIDNLDSISLDNGIINLFRNAQQVITEVFGLQLKNPYLKRVKQSDESSSHFDIQLLLKKKKDIKTQLTQAYLAEDNELVEELKEKLEQMDTHTKAITHTKENTFLESNTQPKKITGNDNETHKD